MTTDEIMEEITKEHKETEILKLLIDYLIMDNRQLRSDCAEYYSRISAIRKINKLRNNKGKTEGIENLCNLEE